MAKVNIAQAARLAGKHRSTIQRAIKDGKLSAIVGATGEKSIDTAELIRVFGELKLNDDALLHVAAAAKSDTKHHDAIVAIETLREQLKVYEEREKQFQEREEWLKTQLEREQERSRELERRLLPSPLEEAELTQPEKKGFFKRIFKFK